MRKTKKKTRGYVKAALVALIYCKMKEESSQLSCSKTHQ